MEVGGGGCTGDRRQRNGEEDDGGRSCGRDKGDSQGVGVCRVGAGSHYTSVTR